MNFASGGDHIMVNSPGVLRAMAAGEGAGRPPPSWRCSTPGHLVQVKELIRDGLLADPVMIQLCMGIAYGAPDDPDTFMALVNQLPPGAVFSAFSISRMQLPFVAMAVLAGGNVRGAGGTTSTPAGPVATNADLVRRAVSILRPANVSVLKPADVRSQLQPSSLGVSVRASMARPERTEEGPIPGLRDRPGCSGGGVIGGGWAARFLLNRVDVRLLDPDPEAPRRSASSSTTPAVRRGG
jgi:hypothetical protein